MNGDAEKMVGELLAVRPHTVTDEEAARLLLDLYGIDGVLEPLSSERDQNFRVTAADGARYVFKFSHPAEDPAVTVLQTAALAHVAAADPSLPVPRVVPTRAGALMGELDMHGPPRRFFRLFSYMPGALLHEIAADARLLRAIGGVAARLDAALASFAHQDAGQLLLWDLTRLSHVRPLLGAMSGDPSEAAVSRAFDAFEQVAAPMLPHLRAGFTHHDLNPYNLLIAHGAVSGVLDFGDMTRAPLVCDLAIAAAYHLGCGPGALDGAAACVSGYHAVLPLSPEEMTILPALIAGRLAMTIVITEWRARRDPGNAAYILRNNPAARRGLAALEAAGFDAAAAHFRAACTGKDAA
ncbi:phosphotransferase [Sphingosinicella microcystinivorans]|uniref:phosphotransferase n=1 Tax=Sphingosinicella microcystinivorans TaxID=335406 RepID=UPI0022F4026A|nr:phosphotransferase [Sphingosinicella microcystinivorans]WBX85170.1 phosphotransferase [Sphingosinicella microcystinivorans]